MTEWAVHRAGSAGTGRLADNDVRSLAALRAARLSRRRFLGAATALAASVSVAAALGRPVLAADGPSGLLVLPRGRDVALVTPDGTDDRVIVTLQPGEFIADVALSPDRTRVAFGYFTAKVGGGPGGSDIVIAPVAAGTEQTVVVPRDRPGMLLAAPQWSPDGSALVFEAVGLTTTGQAGVTIEWVAADGTGRRTIGQTARYPSFSPDGRSVVSTRALPTGDALWEHPIGGGVPREIIPEGLFLLVAYPRYSPDGSRIAFAGVGDSIVPPQVGTPVAPPGSTAPTTPTAPKLLYGRALPSVRGASPLALRGVLAHGFPAEPWVVPSGGGEPRQIAPMPIDDAAVAWSPDGDWLAVSGASGLFMVNAADGTARRVTDNGSFGAIDWR